MESELKQPFLGVASVGRFMRKAGVATALIVFVQTSASSEDQVPAPGPEPDWSEVRQYSEARLKRSLVDPESANITWINGFRWASVKRPLNRRRWGWVGCGQVNSRNRMGGYAGTTSFYIVWNDGFIEGYGDFERYSVFASETCGKLPFVPMQAAFQKAETKSEAAPSSIADELRKFGDLLEKGLISQEEYDSIKKRLLEQ